MSQVKRKSPSFHPKPAGMGRGPQPSQSTGSGGREARAQLPNGGTLHGDTGGRGTEMRTTAGMGLQQQGRASCLQNNSLWSCFLAQALKTSWVVIICIRFKLCNKHFSLLMPDCSQLQLKSPMDQRDERPNGSERGTGGSGELVPAHLGPHQTQKINLLLSLWSHHVLQSHPSVVLSVSAPAGLRWKRRSTGSPSFLPKPTGMGRELIQDLEGEGKEPSCQNGGH